MQQVHIDVANVVPHFMAGATSHLISRLLAIKEQKTFLFVGVKNR
jgi:beta-lactamase regulating signal transducer with metallopeptidase domain